jgi:hypothetical protein
MKRKILLTLGRGVKGGIWASVNISPVRDSETVGGGALLFPDMATFQIFGALLCAGANAIGPGANVEVVVDDSGVLLGS